MKETTSVEAYDLALIVKEVLGSQRDKAGKDLYYILLTRKETNVRFLDENNELTTLESRLSFNGVAIHADNGKESEIKFHAHVKPMRKTVSLTNRDVIIRNNELHGHRIGSYIMSEIVTWAKKWPDASVDRISVVEMDADTDQKKIRRNRFYEQFNIPFKYYDEDKRAGYSTPVKAGDLEPATGWKINIEILDTQGICAMLAKKRFAVENQKAHLERDLKHLKHRLSTIFEQPIRFVAEVYIRRLIDKSGPLFIGLLIIILMYVGYDFIQNLIGS